VDLARIVEQLNLKIRSSGSDLRVRPSERELVFETDLGEVRAQVEEEGGLIVIKTQGGIEYRLPKENLLGKPS
jgi:hypothetical protein